MLARGVVCRFRRLEVFTLDVRAGVMLLVATVLLTGFLFACKQGHGGNGEPPGIPGVPRVGLVVEQLISEYASNSLLFTQDRVNQKVVALGRVDQVLPDGTAVFWTDASSSLWCVSESSGDWVFLEEGVWVLLRGRIAGLTEVRVRLEQCEFREFYWVSG